jgi:hypothetical protein
MKIRVIPGKYWVPCAKGFSLEGLFLPAGETEYSDEDAAKIKSHPDYELLVSIGAIEVLSDLPEIQQTTGRKKKETVETAEA